MATTSFFVSVEYTDSAVVLSFFKLRQAEVKIIETIIERNTVEIEKRQSPTSPGRYDIRITLEMK